MDDDSAQSAAGGPAPTMSAGAAQAFIPDGDIRPEPLPVTMAEMAQDYADLIRKVQPAGPYHLPGWSLGGNIAFAIAEELERRGEQTWLLFHPGRGSGQPRRDCGER